MFRFTQTVIVISLTLLLLATDRATAQRKDCLPPVALPTPSDLNVFSDEQEVFLGDAVAEQIQKNYKVIEDPAVTEYLTKIGNRLTQHLPITKLRFQFFLVELPNANAFVIPGGRIYVSRKLVAAAQSEDELAGVIAHELGHLVAHESAVDVTRRLREVLNVTSVGDRRDVFEKYNQLIENFRRKPEAFKPRDREGGQMTADQAGLYALIKAGYDPSALTRFWDRITETKGKTGNWFSDLFGTTRPEERRLREMVKTVNSLPPECLQARAAEQNDRYKEWQADVISYSGLGRKELLHGLIVKRDLSPPLRTDIKRLRFSPDGTYILAQDDSGINVLTREPFGALFRIETEDAHAARFTPDSKNIVFSTDNLRVEKWNITEQKLTDAKEIVLRKGCLQTSLSPDGKLLACLQTNMDLALIDVATGQSSFQSKEFFELTFSQIFRLYAAIADHRLDNGDAGIHFLNMEFSPDARYFITGFVGPDHINSFRTIENVLAVDLATMNKISFGDNIKKLVIGGFTFMASDRLAGVNYNDYKKSAVVSFPDGRILSEFPLRGAVEAPSRGEYLLVRPVKDYALGVLDLNTKTIFKSNKQPALDIYGDVFVDEMRNGELGLYRMEKNQIIATTLLSNINLGRLRVAELSSDLKWVALSATSRGGVWNLENGQATLYLRGFMGAHFGEGSFYADFPKYETAERNVARFNLGNGEVTPGKTIEAASARQIGPYLVVSKSAKADANEKDLPREWKNIVVDVLDARNLSPLWSRTFNKEAPDIRIAPQFNTATLIWSVNSDAAKAIIKDDAKLTKSLNELKEKEGDYLLEVVDSRNGNSIGRLLIETGKGSFRLSSVYAAGDWVIAADNRNRVLVYSLATGAQVGRVFGGFATVSVQSALLCVENETGKLAVYNLKNMEKVDELVFSNPISMLRFNSDAKQLFVLTSNQTVYVLDAAALSNASSRN